MDIPKASRKLAHGTACWCGTCGAPGRWDCKDPKIPDFDNAIWYNPSLPNEDNTELGCIECYECWLK